jgi:hypothetical protein
MQKIAKLAIVALLFAVMSMTSVHAQTNTNTYRTNVLLTLSFKLTSYEQVYLFLSTNGFDGPYAASAKSASVATDGVIRAIAKQAHITNDVSNAKLYFRLSWTDPAHIGHDIILRRGSEDYVVNNYVLVNFPDSVSQVRATLNGTTNVTDYANCNVSLGTSLGSFTLHGLATIKSGSLFNGRTLIDPTPTPQSFTASVAGSGSIGLHQAEWKGTVMGAGQKVEIVLDNP